MTFLRLNNENESAFFSLGESVEPLVGTAWTCTIYRVHTDPVVTLLETDLGCVRKTWRDKTLFLDDTVVCYKVRGHLCHGNFIITPNWLNPLYQQHSWYTSFHKKNTNYTYLLFSMRKVNEKTEESFPWGRLHEYFSSQVVTATPRAEWFLSLRVITNKMPAIPNQKGPRADA